MQVEVASIVERMIAAGQNWESALDAHVLAPPDAGFAAAPESAGGCSCGAGRRVRPGCRGRPRLAIANDRRPILTGARAHARYDTSRAAGALGTLRRCDHGSGRGAGRIVTCSASRRVQ